MVVGLQPEDLIRCSCGWEGLFSQTCTRGNVNISEAGCTPFFMKMWTCLGCRAPFVFGNKTHETVLGVGGTLITKNGEVTATSV
jgi:hypothetical protein